MLVRAARMDEVEEIVRLERGVATAPHWGAGVYREMVDGGGVRRCLLVGDAGGMLVGFAVGSVVGDEGEVESIAVRETARRRGGGGALLEGVMAWCRAA